MTLFLKDHNRITYPKLGLIWTQGAGWSCSCVTGDNIRLVSRRSRDQPPATATQRPCCLLPTTIISSFCTIQGRAFYVGGCTFSYEWLDIIVENLGCKLLLSACQRKNSRKSSQYSALTCYWCFSLQVDHHQPVPRAPEPGDGVGAALCQARPPRLKARHLHHHLRPRAHSRPRRTQPQHQHPHQQENWVVISTCQVIQIFDLIIIDNVCCWDEEYIVILL